MTAASMITSHCVILGRLIMLSPPRMEPCDESWGRRFSGRNRKPPVAKDLLTHARSRRTRCAAVEPGTRRVSRHLLPRDARQPAPDRGIHRPGGECRLVVGGECGDPAVCAIAGACA